MSATWLPGLRRGHRLGVNDAQGKAAPLGVVDYASDPVTIPGQKEGNDTRPKKK